MAILKNNPLIYSLLLITFFSMLAYLPLIPFMGFYSDDFFFAYVSHFYGIPGIMQSLVVDRPFNGYLLTFNYFLLGLGDNVFLWHIYNFLIRLLGGYVLFFSLKKIWPNRLSIVTYITLLFLIYPGFLQQTLPLGFGGWIANLTLWTFSLFFTVFAIKDGGGFKFILSTLIALILQINSLLQLEFFIGMEVLRFLLIIHILRIKINFKDLKKKIIYWSPYLISTLLFIFWRIIAFKSIRPETDINWVAQTYYSDPLWIVKIPQEVIYSFLNTVIFAFFIPIVINFIRLPFQYSIISIALGIISFILLFLFFKNISINKNNKFNKQLLFIGIISVVASIIPIIISGRSVRIFNVLDRYTITTIIGVSFIITSLLLFRFSQLKKIIMIFIISISVTSHLMNGYWHKVMWDHQIDLWWQLYWRAPQIEDNAMLILDFPQITKDISFKSIINDVQWYRFYWVEEQIWSSGNLFFNYKNPPITHFQGDFLADEGVLEKIQGRFTENIVNRNIRYNRDFNNTVVISTPSDTSCLWVLDKNIDELPLSASEKLKSSRMYSDTNKLIQKGYTHITPPKQIFGEEPTHGWCYYFQKASLARQLKSWDQLAELKEEVIRKNLKPEDPNEWLPFQENIR